MLEPGREHGFAEEASFDVGVEGQRLLDGDHPIEAKIARTEEPPAAAAGELAADLVVVAGHPGKVPVRRGRRSAVVVADGQRRRVGPSVPLVLARHPRPERISPLDREKEKVRRTHRHVCAGTFAVPTRQLLRNGSEAGRAPRFARDAPRTLAAAGAAVKPDHPRRLG